MRAGDDFSTDIRINKSLGNGKMLSKDIPLPVTADETNEGNGPLRDFRADLEGLVPGREEDRPECVFLDDLQRRSSLEATVPVVLIVEELEVLRLGSEVTIAPEPLGAKKSAVVGIIEAFHRSIAPGFSDGNEHHFDPQG